MEIEAPRHRNPPHTIAPRNAIEPVGDGEPRWKGGAVHIEYGTWAASRGVRWRQPGAEIVASPHVALRSSNAIPWDPALAQSSAAFFLLNRPTLWGGNGSKCDDPRL